MYSKSFYIKTPVGNNSFGQPKREGRILYVSKMIKGDFEDLKIGEKIAFEEIDGKGNIVSFKGVKDFIETSFKGVKVYIFDNHNHAFYFWNSAKKDGLIHDGAILVHIDEHSDMREPEKYLGKNESLDLSKVFEYTNYVLNVGNYILPAINTGLINKVYNIQSEIELDNIISEVKNLEGELILNLDLDFFSTEMEYIDYNKKKSAILELAQKAKIITISTSPFFIDGRKAVNICKEIFS